MLKYNRDVVIQSLKDALSKDMFNVLNTKSKEIIIKFFSCKLLSKDDYKNILIDMINASSGKSNDDYFISYEVKLDYINSKSLKQQTKLS